MCLLTMFFLRSNKVVHVCTKWTLKQHHYYLSFMFLISERTHKISSFLLCQLDFEIVWKIDQKLEQIIFCGFVE